MSSTHEPLLGHEKYFSFKKESKEMWALAWPIIVSGVCRFLMAATDTAFVGHIEDGEHSPGQYLAAASLAQMCQLLILAPPCAFSFAVNPLVAQSLGAGNRRLAGMWFQLSLIFAVISNIIPTILMFFVDDALRLFKFDEEIAYLGGLFAKPSCYWAVPNLWYQCCRFYFQAQGMPRPAMYNNIGFVVVNFFLNYLLIFGSPIEAVPFKGLGFVGAPISLSLSRILQPLTYAIYMFGIKGAHSETWPGFSAECLSKPRLKAYLHQSIPNMGTFFFQSVVVQAKTLMIAQLGPLAVAASSAVTNIQSVAAGGVGTCASQVTAIRVGYHLGDGDAKGACKTSKLMLYAIGCFMLSVSLLFTLENDALLKLMTSDKEVQELGATILPIITLVMAGQMVAQAGNDGVLNAQSRTKLVALLSFGVEIPLSIGGTAALLFVFHLGLVNVTWGQAAINLLLASVIGLVWSLSDWNKFAREAQLRNEAHEEDEEDPVKSSGGDDQEQGSN